jgi:pimeloyl-ACP methyl ester carboxylesterase
MPKKTRIVRWLAPFVLALVVGAPATHARADVVTMKDGRVLNGLVDNDGTLVSIFDHEGLRRTVVRDSKIESTTSAPAPRAERFRLVQPLTVHAGQMPPVAYDIDAAPWDALGRRKFRYTGASGKPVEMTQALIELGPYAVKYRGVDGFWQGGVAISQVPRPVVLGLLAKVDPKNLDERVRVGQLLLQAEWYDEARAELDRLERDFPELNENVAAARALLVDAESRGRLAEIDRRTRAGQPRAAERLLRAFPTEGLPADIAQEVRNRLRIVAARRAEDRALADDLRSAADALPAARREAFEPLLLEMLRALDEAPDAVRGRLEPFHAAGRGTSPEALVGLAATGWLLGTERARTEFDASLWGARSLLRDYLLTTADQEEARASIVNQLAATLDLPTLNAMALQLVPPLHDGRAGAPEQVRTIRVHDDPNPDLPSEYAIWLPPEYHPLRSYPAVVVLHGPESPAESLEPWIVEALRRGLVLIAPEYNLPGRGRGYRYSSSEHAAVQLALRDALRRFQIDPDRVTLVGTLQGGNMAWDLALAHPDLFAGAAVISGQPAKYAWPYRANVPLVPLYIAIGELTPGEDAVAFEQWAKPLISRNNDVTYVKFFKRGMEPLPEEIPAILDWAATRTRIPSPKQFEAVSARDGDVRFFGVVARAFSHRRTISPEAADQLGQNIPKPAEIKARANTVLNKLGVDVNGINALDVWVGPPHIDFTKRVEVQVNGRTVYRAQPRLDDLAPYLEDLRIRGDRKQSYWLKVPVDLTTPRGRAGS